MTDTDKLLRRFLDSHRSAEPRVLTPDEKALVTRALEALADGPPAAAPVKPADKAFSPFVYPH